MSITENIVKDLAQVGIGEAQTGLTAALKADLQIYPLTVTFTIMDSEPALGLVSSINAEFDHINFQSVQITTTTNGGTQLTKSMAVLVRKARAATFKRLQREVSLVRMLLPKRTSQILKRSWPGEGLRLQGVADLFRVCVFL